MELYFKLFECNNRRRLSSKFTGYPSAECVSSLIPLRLHKSHICISGTETTETNEKIKRTLLPNSTRLLIFVLIGRR